MKKFIEKLQFITHDLTARSHLEQASIACEAGAKWIQYRCLSKPDDQLLQDIHAIAEICDDWGATLIVTDHVHLHGLADIQGFHIEDMDADFRKLREQLGEAVTLGGSATDIEGLIRIADEGADYAGFGPFADTTTKPNNYNLLGLQGYRKAMHKLQETHPEFPVVAVGGVALSDVDELMQTGIFGIAASAAINQATDMRSAYLDFYARVMA
jgi:thiamine-phosphate pyrophosphorylase